MRRLKILLSLWVMILSSFGMSQLQGYHNQSTSSYAYDINGSLRLDPSKEIELTNGYNNLPNQIVFKEKDSITYRYATNGQKLSKVKISNGLRSETNYLDGIEY